MSLKRNRTIGPCRDVTRFYCCCGHMISSFLFISILAFVPSLLKFINASFLNHLWSLGSVFYAFLLHSLAFWRDALAPSARLAKNPQDYAVGEDFSDPCDK